MMFNCIRDLCICTSYILYILILLPIFKIKWKNPYPENILYSSDEILFYLNITVHIKLEVDTLRWKKLTQ